MRVQHSLVLAAILFAAGPASAQEQTPADVLAITLQQDQLLTAGVVGPILDDPRVTDADKELVRKALKPMDDALATMKQNAAAKPSIEQIQADQQKVVQASEAMITLLQSRMDFNWIQVHGKGLQQFEAEMMQSKPADFAGLIKAAGADDAHAAKAKVIIDNFKIDFDNLRKQTVAAGENVKMADQMALAASLSEKSLAAIKGINTLLTPQQLFDLEWAVTKPMRDNDDEREFFTLGFASQPAMLLAPEAGTYLLESITPDSKGDPKQLASVTLKKGDPIGFKKTDKATTASAGDKTFDVPADSVTGVFWELSAK